MPFGSTHCCGEHMSWFQQSENGNEKEKCWHFGSSGCEEQTLTMFQTLMKIISAYPLKFQMSSKVSHRKGWEPSQNSSWLATSYTPCVCGGGQCLNQPLALYPAWMAATRMLQTQLFLPPVKPQYFPLAICEWGNDKINKHTEWLSLPQYLHTGPNSLLLPSGIHWHL